MSVAVAAASSGWIGVDLDGTLAQYDRWRGPEHIGAPIEAMVGRVKGWLERGHEVRIVTARASSDMTVCRQREAAIATLAIQDWCAEHLGRRLPVTCMKDYAMIEIWDDRAVTVIANTGIPVDGALRVSRA